jgi:transposase
MVPTITPVCLVKRFAALSRLGDFLTSAVGPEANRQLQLMEPKMMEEHPTTEAPRKTYHNRRGQKLPKHLETLNWDAAGIDIGSSRHYVCVPEGRCENAVANFGCFTADLKAMAQWLLSCGVKTVVMESTGIYWVPVYRMLEEHNFDVHLVDARHVKYVPGRKTDVLDCQWLQRLHTYGLLSSAYVPDASVVKLRNLWRHRHNIVADCSRDILHMQKALTEMNLHLHVVLSDITGLTGMKIIRAILAGERDPVILAKMKHPFVKCPEDEIAKALDGQYRADQLFVLQQAVESHDFHQHQLRVCDQEIQTQMAPFERKLDLEPHPLGKGKRKPRKNEPHFDMASELHQILGVDLTSIDGIEANTAFTIFSELGTDLSRFASVKHFTSWLGLCPNNEVTGGKVKRRRTKKTQNRVAQALRLAAQSLWRSHTYLGAFFRRMNARKGPKKAITATAHKIARLVYTLYTQGQAYIDKGQEYEDQKNRERQFKSLVKKAAEFGCSLLDTETGELISFPKKPEPVFVS